VHPSCYVAVLVFSSGEETFKNPGITLEILYDGG
jgi:hypothetical protein